MPSSMGPRTNSSAGSLTIDIPMAQPRGEVSLEIDSPRSAAFKLKHGSLRVLGLEIGSCSTANQYLICTLILFFFTILYGYLQEMVTIHIFERRFGLFVTLLQFGGYTFFAFLQWLSRETKHSSLPMSYCVSLAVLQASMQGLSNLSIKYLNYPAKVLFKSSRVIPTMLFGVVFYGKRYKLSEYGVMGVLVLGLVIFMGADATTSPDFDPIGVVLILASLMVDACIINLQEYMFNHFQSDEEEMIFMSYAGGSLVLLLICMATGEMSEGLAFIDQHGASRINIVIFIYAACGFCGVSCVAALTKRFGALTAALTTTARKAITILLSFLIFPKPFVFGHACGAVLFISGLLARSRQRGGGERRRPPTTELPERKASDG